MASNVSIATRPLVYSTFRYINNKVWNALAEYIDNSIQSFEDHREELVTLNRDGKLHVRIDIDFTNETITILDDAYGITEQNYQRAFELANLPLDNQGLNEFGMGMKTAAAWLGNNWSVKTSALDETVERFYNFNLQYVLDNEVRELPYTEKDCELKSHYTEIRITEPTKNSPGEKSLKKIKNELASIYRQSLRAKEMELYVCNEKLEFEEYPILLHHIFSPFSLCQKSRNT